MGRGPQRLRGRFPDWEAACRDSTGYDRPAILQRLVAAAEEVAGSDGRKYERDGVVFTEPVTPFPLLTFLLLVAGRNGSRLTVLDFGGSLGSTYRQCQRFLSHLTFLRWHIVEQSHIAAEGKLRFENDILRFHGSIEDALAEGRPDVVVLSGVLQYLEDPYKILARAVSSRPTLIVIDRSPFSEMEKDAFSLQVVADAIYPARLPFRIFGVNSLESSLLPAYRIVAAFDTVDPDMMAGSVTVRFRGKVFERTEGEQQG